MRQAEYTTIMYQLLENLPMNLPMVIRHNGL